MDEIKRAIDLIEYVPFKFCVQHVARARDVADQRLWDATFSSLEHLSIFAKQRGVMLALENRRAKWLLRTNTKLSRRDAVHQHQDVLRRWSTRIWMAA